MRITSIADIGPPTLLALLASVISTAVSFVFFQSGPFVFFLGVYQPISVHLKETLHGTGAERHRVLLDAGSRHSREVRDTLERGHVVAIRAAAIQDPYLRSLAEVLLER